MEIVRCVVWTFAVLLAHHEPIFGTSHIQVDSDGGYTKIVVAISPRVDQSRQLLQNLKEYLLDVSTKLYTATRSRAFFREIQILVPNTWTKYDGSNFPESTFENYPESDIRIDNFNPLPEKGKLYTQQPRGCGQKGDFIYLHPSLIENWEKNQSNEFVKEWSKFRYGVFDEHGYGNKLYPNFYPDGKETLNKTGCSSIDNKFISIMDDWSFENTYCDTTEERQHNKFAPNPQNTLCNLKDTWTVVSSNPDLANITSTTAQPRIIDFTVVKASTMQVVFVIDPLLCLTTMDHRPLVLTILQFLMKFPSSGKVGFVIADERSEGIKFEKRKVSEHLRVFGNYMWLCLPANRNIEKGVEKGIMMILQSSLNGHLILVSDGPKLNSEDFQSLFKYLDKMTFFLLTWTSKSSKLKYNLTDMKEFLTNPSRCLWTNIQLEASFHDCDPSARMQLEDALALFFAKFENNDFYPHVIKIYENIDMAVNSSNYFVNPAQKAKLIFNMYSCKLNSHDDELSLIINAENISLTYNVLSYYATYNLMNSPSKIKYEWTASNHEMFNHTSSVWLVFDTKPEIILTSQIEEFSTKQFVAASPMIYYAFNPKNYVLTAEITQENGSITKLDLRDNGNGDPDVMAGDKIYTRYFFNDDVENHLYSAKTVARDYDNSVTIYQYLGSVYIQSSNITQFPPNRIADFCLESIVESSSKARLMWTAPGATLDKGSASAYYMHCSSDFQNINNAQMQDILHLMNNLNITPKISGQSESIDWEIPLPNTVFYCVIVSTNKHSRHSKKSNIVSIFKKTQVNSIFEPCFCSCVQVQPVPIIGILAALVVILLSIIVYLLWKIRIKTVLRNPEPNVNANPLAPLDGQDLQSNQTTRKKPNFYQEKILPIFKSGPSENFVDINIDDVMTLEIDNCLYEEIGESPGYVRSNCAGSNEDRSARRKRGTDAGLEN